MSLEARNAVLALHANKTSRASKRPACRGADDRRRLLAWTRSDFSQRAVAQKRGVTLNPGARWRQSFAQGALSRFQLGLAP